MAVPVGQHDQTPAATVFHPVHYALLLSTLFHAGVILILASWLLPAPAGMGQPHLDTSWDQSLEQVSWETADLAIEQPEIPDEASSLRSSQMTARQIEARSPVPVPDLVEPLPAELAPSDLASSVSDVAMRQTVPTPAQGPGAGGGPSAGVGFFGLESDAKSVVYVVDSSRSMYHPHPGKFKTRFARVQWELLRAIHSLKPQQRFFVIFFSDQAFPMPARDLVPAISQNIIKPQNWIIQFRAGGHTHPESALLLALRLQPQEIYFLTDGEFSRKVVEQVSVANRGRVAIHTIGFGDPAGEELLRAIAQRNGGNYRYIPAEGDPAAAGDEADKEQRATAAASATSVR